MTVLKDRKIPVNLFEIFYELVTQGSFTNAAKSQGVTKAAISHSIKQLEKELKVDLINRTTRSLSLTHEGKLLFNHCCKLKENIDSIRDLSASFHKEPSGTLKISTSAFFAKQALVKLIQEYSRQFPKVKFDVTVEEKMPNLNSQNIDLVFGVNWTPPDDIIARKIAKTRYVLCANEEYIKTYGTPKNIEDLASHKYISHKSRNATIVAMKKAQKLNITKTELVSDNISFIKTCVLNGMGIAQFHEYIVKKEIQNGQLIEILPNEFCDEQQIFMYYQKNKFVQPKVKEFVNLALNTNLQDIL